MNQNTVAGDPSPLPSILSELLLAWTATGRGIDVPDFLRADGAVFTSCLSSVSSRAYESALARFHDLAADDRRPLLDQLAVLERRIDGTDTVPLAPERKREAKERAVLEVKELRERLAKLPLVVWNDPEASRATVLDMVCNKSFYGAVTLFDTGCRAARLVSKQGSSARISECGTVHLAAGGEQGTLIRASTGGASIFIAAGLDRPVMNYYAQATPDILDKLGSRIVKRGSLLPLAGKAVVIYGEPDESQKPVVSAQEYLDLMRTFHLRGARPGSERFTVMFSDEMLGDRHAWYEFSNITLEGFIGSAKVGRLASRLEASMRMMIGAAVHAVLAKKAIEWLRAEPGTVAKNQLVLNVGDLDLAKRFVTYMIHQSKAFAALTSRQQNIAVAHEARVPNDATLGLLSAKLEEAIENSPAGALSRAQALDIDGMTVTTLDKIVASHPGIEEVQGRVEGLGNRTTRSYRLKDLSGGNVEAACDDSGMDAFPIRSQREFESNQIKFARRQFNDANFRSVVTRRLINIMEGRSPGSLKPCVGRSYILEHMHEQDLDMILSLQDAERLAGNPYVVVEPASPDGIVRYRVMPEQAKVQIVTKEPAIYEIGDRDLYWVPKAVQQPAFMSEYPLKAPDELVPVCPEARGECIRSHTDKLIAIISDSRGRMRYDELVNRHISSYMLSQVMEEQMAERDAGRMYIRSEDDAGVRYYSVVDQGLVGAEAYTAAERAVMDAINQAGGKLDRVAILGLPGMTRKRFSDLLAGQMKNISAGEPFIESTPSGYYRINNGTNAPTYCDTTKSSPGLLRENLLKLLISEPSGVPLSRILDEVSGMTPEILARMDSVRLPCDPYVVLRVSEGPDPVYVAEVDKAPAKLSDGLPSIELPPGAEIVGVHEEIGVTVANHAGAQKATRPVERPLSDLNEIIQDNMLRDLAAGDAPNLLQSAINADPRRREVEAGTTVGVAGVPVLKPAVVVTRRELTHLNAFELEKKAEFESAWRTRGGSACLVDAVELSSAYDRLVKKAEQFDLDNNLPCVPITEIDPADMVLAVHLATDNSGSCMWRGVEGAPEPSHLYDDEVPALKRGIPALWFRMNSRGKRFRDWSKSRLGFPQWEDSLAGD